MGALVIDGQGLVLGLIALVAGIALVLYRSEAAERSQGARRFGARYVALSRVVYGLFGLLFSIAGLAAIVASVI